MEIPLGEGGGGYIYKAGAEDRLLGVAQSVSPSWPAACYACPSVLVQCRNNNNKKKHTQSEIKGKIRTEEVKRGVSWAVLGVWGGGVCKPAKKNVVTARQMASNGKSSSQHSARVAAASEH